MTQGVGTLDVSVSCRLMMNISSFELNAVAEPDEARISMRLSLVKLISGDIVSERQFNNSTPVTGQGPSYAVQAFRTGLKSVGGDVAAWLKPVMQECH